MIYSVWGLILNMTQIATRFHILAGYHGNHGSALDTVWMLVLWALGVMVGTAIGLYGRQHDGPIKTLRRGTIAVVMSVAGNPVYADFLGFALLELFVPCTPLIPFTRLLFLFTYG